MNEKTIATIALKDAGYSSLEAMLREAAGLVESAAQQGADLAVLPETINLLHGSEDGVALRDRAIEDWRTETALLCDAAARSRISLVLPLLVLEDGRLANRFYLLARDGSEIGSYQKCVPAVGERAADVQGRRCPAPLNWE